MLDKQTPGPGQLFQIRRRKTNLLIKFAVQLEPCGIVAQTLPALCYTTHKVAALRQRVKESEGEGEAKNGPSTSATHHKTKRCPITTIKPGSLTLKAW